MKFYLLLIILVIGGCTSSPTGLSAINIIKETIIQPQIYFCPQDDCQGVLIKYINNSEKSVHCALYDLDLEQVLDTFSKKSNDIDVKIIIDNINWNELHTGYGIMADSKSQLSHNKFCIFDNSIVLTGSFNPTNNGANKNNNNLIIIESKNLANNYETEFNELIAYNFGKGRYTKNPIIYLNNKKYENYFCPEDNCKKHVLNALNNADKSIYFMTFSFTDFDIANKLIEKNEIGLDVKGIMEAKRVNMQYNQYKNLINNKVNVKKDKNPHTMHHKVFIIDNSTVITGSYNPTKAANTKNDENILIIHDKKIAKRYLEEFERLWN